MSDCIGRPQCHSTKQQKHCCLCQLTRVDQLNGLKNDCRCWKASPEDSFGERSISGVCSEIDIEMEPPYIHSLWKHSCCRLLVLLLWSFLVKYHKSLSSVCLRFHSLLSPIFHPSLCQSLMTSNNSLPTLKDTPGPLPLTRFPRCS